eukprot:jgi/Bigna1/69449/fgenesh1_pg.9_\
MRRFWGQALWCWRACFLKFRVFPFLLPPKWYHYTNFSTHDPPVNKILLLIGEVVIPRNQQGHQNPFENIPENLGPHAFEGGIHILPGARESGPRIIIEEEHFRAPQTIKNNLFLRHQLLPPRVVKVEEEQPSLFRKMTSSSPIPRLAELFSSLFRTVQLPSAIKDINDDETNEIVVGGLGRGGGGGGGILEILTSSGDAKNIDNSHSPEDMFGSHCRMDLKRICSPTETMTDTSSSDADSTTTRINKSTQQNGTEGAPSSHHRHHLRLVRPAKNLTTESKGRAAPRHIPENIFTLLSSTTDDSRSCIAKLEMLQKNHSLNVAVGCKAVLERPLESTLIACGGDIASHCKAAASSPRLWLHCLHGGFQLGSLSAGCLAAYQELQRNHQLSREGHIADDEKTTSSSIDSVQKLAGSPRANDAEEAADSHVSAQANVSKSSSNNGGGSSAAKCAHVFCDMGTLGKTISHSARELKLKLVHYGTKNLPHLDHAYLLWICFVVIMLLLFARYSCLYSGSKTEGLSKRGKWMQDSDELAKRVLKDLSVDTEEEEGKHDGYDYDDDDEDDDNVCNEIDEILKASMSQQQVSSVSSGGRRIDVRKDKNWVATLLVSADKERKKKRKTKKCDRKGRRRSPSTAQLSIIPEENQDDLVGNHQHNHHQQHGGATHLNDTDALLSSAAIEVDY